MNKKEIVQKIETPKGATISKVKRAKIIMDLAKGSTYREIAKEHKTALQSIRRIKQENKELLKELEHNILVDTIEQKERILYSALEHLETELKGNKEYKISDLLDTIKTLKHELRLDTGQATAITHNTTDIRKATLEIKANLDKIENSDKKALLSEVLDIE